MKTKLLTDFICIATSGTTVDGREIRAQDLQEMAQSYDPEKYTANIWVEHYRFSNLGQVAELKCESATDEHGAETVKLFARISPSIELLQYNKRGQGLFTSIEITPNFAKTGKAYLTGLAVTDSPASLGTTRLDFSNRVEKGVIFGAPERLNLTEPQGDAAEYGFFRRFIQWLSEHGNCAEQQNFAAETGKAEDTMDFKDMDEKKLTELLTGAVTTAVTQAFNAHAAQQQAEQKQAEAEQATATQAVSVEEFNALKAEFEALSKKFNKALNTEHTPVPNGGEGVQEFTITTAI